MAHSVNVLPLNITGLYLFLYDEYLCPHMCVLVPAHAQRTAWHGKILKHISLESEYMLGDYDQNTSTITHFKTLGGTLKTSSLASFLHFSWISFFPVLGNSLTRTMKSLINI